MTAAFRWLGMGFSEMVVLLAVCKHEGSSQDDISQSLAIDKAVTAKSVKALEANGYIRRENHPSNGRMKQVFSTPEGRLLKSRIDAAVAVWNEYILADLTPNERTVMYSALRKMARVATTISLDDVLERARARLQT